MNLALFDLDNTLIAGDSDYAWGQFLVDKGIVDGNSYTRENERFYGEYERQTLDIHEYQRFVLTPLMSMTPEFREKLHREFMTLALPIGISGIFMGIRLIWGQLIMPF